MSRMGDLSNPQSSVLSRTAELLNNRKFSDVTLSVKRGEKYEDFHAHKLILAMASKEFSRLFYIESYKCPVLVIDDSSSRAVFLLLQFLYTDKLDFNNEQEAQDVYNLAQKYQIKELKERSICYILRDEITVNNLFSKYECAVQENMTELLMLCRNFASKNTLAVFNSPLFCELPSAVLEDIIQLEQLAVDNELDVLKSVIKWGRIECKRRNLPQEHVLIRDCVNPFLKYIRLLSVSPEQFCDFVGDIENSIFTNHECTVLTRKLLQPNWKGSVPPGFCSISKCRSVIDYYKYNTEPPKPRAISPQYLQESKDNVSEIPSTRGSLNIYNSIGASNHSLHVEPKRDVQELNHVMSTEKYFSYKAPSFQIKQASRVQKVSPQIVRNQHSTFDFPLKEIQRGIGAAFCNDLRCTAKIEMINGGIILHGIELRVKSQKNGKNEILEVFASFSGPTEESKLEKVYNLSSNDDIFGMKFDKPVRLFENQKVEIEVFVEDLKLSRCSICQDKKCELNCGLGIKSKMHLSSNQTSGGDGFFYLISRLIYSSC